MGRVLDATMVLERRSHVQSSAGAFYPIGLEEGLWQVTSRRKQIRECGRGGDVDSVG